MPPSPMKPTVQSVNEKIDLVEGTLQNAVNARITREEVEILITHGIDQLRAQLAEKVERTDIQYVMREYIDDLAAPRSWVDESHSRHNEMRGEIVRVERELTQAINELQVTVSQFRTGIDDKMTRALEIAKANQDKIKSEVDVVTVKMAVIEMKERDEQERKVYEQQDAEAARAREEEEAAEAEEAAKKAEGEKTTPNPGQGLDEHDMGEDSMSNPPGLKGKEDPLLNTAWRPVEEYDISSPPRGKGGGGKGGKDGSDRGNLYEQKGFDKRCQKFSNEKTGLAGEQDFNNFVFDIRKISEHVPHFDKFLEWLCEEQEEITVEVLTERQKEANRDLGDSGGMGKWDVGYFNRQLYGVLRETCIGSAKNSVMSYEEDTHMNGARLLQEFAREHLHGSIVGLAALGQRITKPPKATM